MQGVSKNTHQPCALLSIPVDTSVVVHYFYISLHFFEKMYLAACR